SRRRLRAGTGCDRRRHHDGPHIRRPGRLGGRPARSDRIPALLRRRHDRLHLRGGGLLPDRELVTLSILIWLPLAIAALATLVPRRLNGWAVFAGSLVTFGIAVSFLIRFQVGHSGLQFMTDSVWIASLGIHYKLGLDGLNVLLVVLTCLLF